MSAAESVVLGSVVTLRHRIDVGPCDRAEMSCECFKKVQTFLISA
jgi:hypothetical protein